MDRDKDAWIGDFLEELAARAKPPVPRKFAQTVAVNQWGQHAQRKPVEVAREWLKARPKAKP